MVESVLFNPIVDAKVVISTLVVFEVLLMGIF